MVLLSVLFKASGGIKQCGHHALCMMPRTPEVAGPFVHNKDTMVDGLGLKLHGKCSEAWHLGKPLFRTPQEWCDLKADLPVPDLQNPQRSEPSTRSTVHPFDPRAKTGGEISPNSQTDSSAAGSDGSDDESTAESHHLSGITMQNRSSFAACGCVESAG